jgi:hypothetical protein
MSAAPASIYESHHVYSKALVASRKRVIDLQIMGGDYDKGAMVNMYRESYLKELIKAASKGKQSVTSSARGLQFFIVRGGAEGFLDISYQGIDASRMIVGGGTTTSGKPGTMMVFVNNDLIAAFDRTGKLISSALLSRPISIAHPNIWTELTANKVYAAWDGGPVSIYRNTNFDIKYYGLMVDDSAGFYRSGSVTIDMHKQEATNGCIFIKDDATPPYGKGPLLQVPLSAFEPQFIKDIQAAIGAKEKQYIGIMHMISI